MILRHSIRRPVASLALLTLTFLVSVLLPARADFRAGAAAVDVTPAVLPVLVNGGMFSRSVDTVNTRVHARALVLADGQEQIALVVVDSCMLGRDWLDETKAVAAQRTGIATNRMLISATHAHSTPSAFGCLGTDADPRYLPFLRARIVDSIAQALNQLEPARIGWAKAHAPEFTALRRWIRRPDRLAEDPFGNLTVRANMHAASNWDDVIGESGPEDPDLALVSLQSVGGRPIAVLGNFSMHYFGDHDISADYFGLFAEGLATRLANDTPTDKPPFVGILSHGCSGDIYRVDYRVPREKRPNPTIAEYANGLVDLAVRALHGIEHRADVDLAMTERRMTLKYRVPDRPRLEWARRVVSEMGDRPPSTVPEVYAREQILLHERQSTEIVVQALRIGDIAIAAVPTETYAVTGLKVKAASPLPHTFVIELANGGDGYIPPPEQHLFGGYNTWPARSAGLEVLAEPRITETAIHLLESVARQPRRPWTLPQGPAADAVVSARPFAYWRLNEFTGPIAADASRHGRHAAYEPWITFALEGPHSDSFCGADAVNRAPHFVGGRLTTDLAGLDSRYSVSMWIWNGMPIEARDVCGWFVSKGPDHGLGREGIHLGIGGASGQPGRLILLLGDGTTGPSPGQRTIQRWEWHHVALVRDGDSVRAYLDGELDLETQAPPPERRSHQFFFGGRSDNDSNWEGRIDEIAVFDRPLSAREIRRLAAP
ncbi:MAG: LamG-like jellyroll fold domain-containing protein [Limisphaerales bacterium]